MSLDTDVRTSDPLIHTKPSRGEIDAALGSMYCESGLDDHKLAVVLDKAIRKAAGHLRYDLDDLALSAGQAKALSIHLELGFDSWTDYIVDALSDLTGALSTTVKQFLIDQFHEDGMSVRAIAEKLGLSKSTVHRQVSQSGTGDRGGNVIGIDGKPHPGAVSALTGDDVEQPTSRHNGGRRGAWQPEDYANRAKSFIENINGDDTLCSQICDLIDELLASIQPAT
ncbi:Uncharacterised protein [Mycobacteroides abscessus subsp. massiliense]|uniref:helix-turn-helix domain-containing protein n=1 Tax=Mycobacteroides abscessus TaxID=36809 RepID=UPI0009CB8CE2|nr:helix-turn-helix domain-containing protein [Mycobacteroides abscessus]SLH95738.1 Uncharacterised protein [Mycobacteroides abscessus subsp. massiliense]SLI84274.1 Uncharacterised protein [Mycobacteroides abscessus subsp. massiliense]